MKALVSMSALAEPIPVTGIPNLAEIKRNLNKMVSELTVLLAVKDFEHC